jgi:hypothetical protein
MRAVDVTLKKHKWMVLLHQCERCWKEITNIPAPDDDLVSFSQRLPEERLKRQKGRKSFQSDSEMNFLF